MRVWLITIGEPVPIGDEAGARIMRAGLLAHHLAGRGHDVTWWTSTFDHTRKVHRFAEDRSVRVGDGLEIRLLKGRGYARNISLARIVDHRQVAAKFAAQAPACPKPDVVVCSLPTLELCTEATRYGRAARVPVVLDVRDLWPDLFLDAFPPLLRLLARLALTPMYREARKACAAATAITGITDEFVRWGVARAGRAVGPLDRSFPMGYPTLQLTDGARDGAEAFWREWGVVRDDGRMTACFIGSLTRVFDMETVLAATARLRERGCPFRLVVCGAGPRLEELRRAAGNRPDVLFPGWVDAAQIHVLMRLADVGIDPLPDHLNWTSNINNKAIEYLSAGLPVVASPAHGVLHDLIVQNGCGFTYEVGDADGLANGLQRLSADRDGLVRMRRHAAELFARRFRAESVYAEVEAYLGEVVAAFREGRAGSPA